MQNRLEVHQRGVINTVQIDRCRIPGTFDFGEDRVTRMNAFVGATPEINGAPYKNGLEMVATYMPVAAADDVYVINDKSTEGHLPGSVFAPGLRDARPFEAYLTGSTAARYLPIFDTVGRLVRIADVKAGQTHRVTDLSMGIYLVDSIKLYLK